MIQLTNNIKMNLIYQPETYKTLLNGEKKECSEYTIIRRKLSKMLKFGLISSKTIKNSANYPGREIIFYVLNKEYFIIFTKNNVYYCQNTKLKDNELILLDSYILCDKNWKKVGDKNIDISEVVLCF